MKKSTVVIALLAVLAIVFGILFITGNNEKNDWKAKYDKLTTDGNGALADAEAALAAAEQNAADAKTAAEQAVADAKAEGEKALADAQAAAEQAAAEAKTAADEALANAKAEGEKALADAKTAAEETLASVKAEGEQALADARAAAEQAVADAKAEGEKAVEAARAEGEAALKTVQEELEGWKTKAADLETQLAEKAGPAAEEALANVKAEGEKALADAKAAAEETLANVKAEGEKALADAKAAAEQAVADAKAEGEKAVEAARAEGEAALKTVQEELEGWKTKAADLEAQIAAAAAAAAEKVEDVKETAEEVVENVTETVEEKAEEAAEAVAEGAEAVEAAVEEAAVMDHAAYAAAELDTEVMIETTVQATQSWWDDKITVYAQSEDGAYFIYNMACSKEDAEKLVAGTKIKVKGFKSEWSGEVEITDATFEFVDGEGFKAEAFDATDLLGKDELIEHQNELVAFKGMTVEAYDESGAAFAYKNAENKTDDLYFKVSKDGATYDFCVEFYLCGQDTEVYKAVEALNVGDVVDLEGFLYWYNGANPHITKVTAAQ